MKDDEIRTELTSADASKYMWTMSNQRCAAMPTGRNADRYFGLCRLGRLADGALCDRNKATDGTAADHVIIEGV